jgi:hypothetical protein
MATHEKTEFFYTILPDGQIQVRKDRVILDGTSGEELARRPHRFVVEPGQDMGEFSPRLKNICQVIWTEDVKKAYREAKELAQEKMRAKKEETV